MTQDEIIEMAVKAGMEVHSSKGQIRIGSAVFTGEDTTNQVVAFAELVAEKEREACAKKADEWSKRDDDVGAFIGRAIRARGQA